MTSSEDSTHGDPFLGSNVNDASGCVSEKFVYQRIPGEHLACSASDAASHRSDSQALSSVVEGQQEDQEEEFVYRGADLACATSNAASPHYSQAPDTVIDDEQEDQEEAFVYPGVTVLGTTATNNNQLSRPTAAQLESLFAAASSGDLAMLKKLFEHARDSGVEPFSLANDATSRTGSTALHAAASRGCIDIVMWLVENCGAMPDLEDREGETALHRASLNGHADVVHYLIERGADIHARDFDGWTALHNACSKGYLDIVRQLCAKDGVAADALNINSRSNDGWTPLMNASSKGHLPIVLYLIKQGADPLVRNKWGETAFDIAAAVFEVWICELLQQAEAERWWRSRIPYNPLAVHTTLPVMVYEYQKLDTRLKTLARTGGRPIFSASGLGRQGRKPPYELKFPKPEPDVTMEETTPSAWRSSIQLPLRDSPWIFPTPGKVEKSESDDRSHFWLSDWILDVTHPKVDARDGWQYAHHFHDSDEQWTAEKPGTLERLLSEGGVVASSGRVPQKWVRRRRWVRVMRQRIDIPPLPFLQPDGWMYHLTSDGGLVPYTEQAAKESNESPAEGGQELGTMAPSLLSNATDYVARARYLVGDAVVQYPSSTAAEIRRSIAKLERATMELRQGILGDDDGDRRTQAEVLLKAYSRRLEREACRCAGLEEQDDGDSSEDDFHYPGSSEDRRSISRESSSIDFTTRPSVSRAPIDLTPQLSQAPDFRVPTREAPQSGLASRRTSMSTLQGTLWEKDENVSNCRSCQCRFGLLTRRHCRKCGRIFCDSCSTFRVLLDPSEIVHESESPEAPRLSSSQRVCKTCYDETTAATSIQDKTIAMLPITVESKQPIINKTQRSNSQLSELSLPLCPVCKARLEGDFQAQENHVRKCLERGSKYLLYFLPTGSSLIGVECTLCLEKFVKGTGVALPSCLCNFHNACLLAWLQRGKICPVHAR